MSFAVATLHRVVRLPVVAKHLGQLSMLLSGLTLVPATVALFEQEFPIAGSFLLVALVLAAVGVPLARLHIAARIQPNEALTISALAYLLAALAGVWPLTVSGVAWDQAVFEMVSGVTTTGLSTLGSVESLPDSILFARAWNQWYGGLGIAVLAVVLLASYDQSAHRLVEADPEERLYTTALTYARQVTKVYLALTLVGIVTLLCVGLPFGEAVTHLLAAVSTGGFGTHDNNLAGLSSRPAQVVLSLFSVLGAVSLPLYYAAATGHWRRVAQNVDLRALVVCILLVSLLLLGLGWLDTQASSPLPVLDRVLLGISAQTTSGFSTMKVSTLGDASMALLIASMAVGGSLGSTSGGIKLFRLVLGLRLLKLLLNRLAMPSHAVTELTVGGHKVATEEALRAMTLVLLFPAVAFVSWLPFLVAGYAPLPALFEVVSALGTVGLSSGIASPDLPGLLKAVLCLDMLLGRLEFIALLVVLTPTTWIGSRSS